MEAVYVSELIHPELMLPFGFIYRTSQHMLAEFLLCEALAHHAVGNTLQGKKSLLAGALILQPSVDLGAPTTMGLMEGYLRDAKDKELERLNLPHRCDLPDRPADDSNLSF
jgi:hypothetical protein